jgi:hypothetical protein
MSAVASNSAVLPVPGFPAGVDVHWETQRRIVWKYTGAHERGARAGLRDHLDPRAWSLAQVSTVAAQAAKLKKSSLAEKGGFSRLIAYAVKINQSR